MDNQAYFDAGIQSQKEIGAESLAAHEAALSEARLHAQAVAQATQSPRTSGMDQQQINAEVVSIQKALADALRAGSWKKGK